MAWTVEQRAAAITSFWQGGVIQCPQCGSEVDLVPASDDTHQSPDGTVYPILVNCSGTCKPTTFTKADDPLHRRFRKYTDDEHEKIVQDHRTLGTATCPVDDTTLEVAPNHTNDAKRFNLHCPRCSGTAFDERRFKK